MNAGRDYGKAKEHAQANADLTDATWVLWKDAHGIYWIERDWITRKFEAESFEPRKAE